jgi:hypothetical protein
MNINLLLYLAAFCENLYILSMIYIAIALVTMLINYIVTFDQDDELRTTSRKFRKKLFIPILYAIFFLTILPDKTTIYMMMANDVMTKSEVPQKVLTIINKSLDNIIARKSKQ